MALAASTVSVLTLAACTLPGGAPHGPSYHVTAEFTDVLDLVPQASVKVNDVTVGSVEKITLSGWNARVEMVIDRGVQLPANATAAIGQTSLLGEKYVALSAPVDQPSQGTLSDGAVIPLSHTTRSAEVEEVLGALGLLLNGGGLAQIKTISEELTKALSGRESTVTDLLRQLDTFLAGLDAQKADIVRAIDALDRLSGHLVEQRTTIAKALDALGPGLTVLADQRKQLTAALTALSQLSSVGTHVVESSRQNTVASLRSLQPILDQLVSAGDSLPKALDFLLTYPFPPDVTGAISGDSVRLHATLDLDGAEILANLLTESNPPAAANGGGSTLLPVPPPSLPVPVPTLPPLPPPANPAHTASHAEPVADPPPDRPVQPARTPHRVRTMITRIARIQVLVFLVVGLVGVAFVGIRYVGLGDRLLGTDYTVHADLTTAGGIYPNAPVTYRGVPIGRVEAVRLHGDLVRVDMRLTRSVPVPRDLSAVVAERSAVGEQYLDLRPDTDTGPYLRDGDVIPVSRTSTPLPIETLLTNLDALARSVDPGDLSVLIDELGTAFEGNETALQQILESSSELLAAANQYLPQTQALIDDSSTVLSTQIASSDAIRRWASALAQLTATVRGADPDLRRLLTAGPPAATQLIGLLRDLDPTIGTLLGNLVTINGIAAERLPGIQQILVVYPLVVAGGFTVAPGDGTAHFGLVVSASNPPCQYRQTGATGCTPTERANGSGVRSSAAAPGPTGVDPTPAPMGGPTGPGAAPATAEPPPTVAGFDPATGLVNGSDGLPLEFGGTGGQSRLAGAQSWKELLLAGLSP